MPKAIPLEEQVKNCNEIYELIEIFKDLALTLYNGYCIRKYVFKKISLVFY